MEITYESIAPLIASCEEKGGAVKVTFKCPKTDVTVQSQASLRKSTDMKSRLAQSAKSTVKWRLRHAISSSVRGALGYGLLGSFGSGVVNAAISSAGTQPSFTDEEKQAAMVDAFETIQHRFTWDAESSSWISAEGALELMTEFARKLGDAPITKRYDRGVLARMMVEIANADGQLTDEEKESLGSFLTPDVGTVADLAAKPPLSKAELEETSSGAVRETMLMLAWALAFCDEELVQSEVDRVQQLADGLGLDSTLTNELKGFSQKHIVDQALAAAYAGGKRDEGLYSEAQQIAQRIGLATDDLERVEIRLRKRNGLV